MATRIALDSTQLLADARELLPDVVQLRRRIHAEPEIGLELPKTQAKVLEALGGLDLAIETGDQLSSVVATLSGDADGPTLLLRGDMDALPLTEDSGESFASTVPGAMHACGHDSHVAMLAGAARLLHARRRDLRGNVKFMFQPGEEGHHGARYCLEEGLLDNPKVDAAFALHISPNHRAGSLATKPGPLLASADTLTITVNGQGGHASAPHRAVDPIPVACEIVMALQTHITRTVDIFDPAVLTIAQITAGTTNNIIPPRAELVGTLRTQSNETREKVLAGAQRVAEGIAAAHGCTVVYDVERGYGPTINDAEFAGYAIDVLSELIGDEHVSRLESPIMAAEDWSYVLDLVPGAMVMLGVCPADVEPEQAHACHSNHMRIDEEAMAVGMAAHAAIALNYLG
ncbi:MAG: M20 family metallopeptidase [Acidimicrobiia bacterium]|nr:M20 family metallopeptidase [Acidimicrobiia bacterium]